MLGRFRLGFGRPEDRPGAITAIARDTSGIVLLASLDGERFRTIERLPRTAAEANELYEASQGPTMTADDVRHLYGKGVAKMRLG